MWGTLGRVPGYGGGLVSGTQCYYSCALEASVPPPWGLDSPRPVLPQPLPTYTVAREAFEKTAWNVSLPCVSPGSNLRTIPACKALPNPLCYFCPSTSATAAAPTAWNLPTGSLNTPNAISVQGFCTGRSLYPAHPLPHSPLLRLANCYSPIRPQLKCPILQEAFPDHLPLSG